jgi:polar amino acid transport system substrate-binding protein
MMAWKRIVQGLVLVAALIGSAGAAAAEADTLADIKARGKLLVAIDIGLPPFGMVDDRMQPTGSDVEAARLLAAHIGVPLEIVPATGPNRIPFLLTGKVDAVMSSFSITEERKKVVAFSAPYGMISIICAAPKAISIASAADLAGKTVAVTRGTGADMDATKLAKADPKISMARFEDDATLITALATGQQDIMIAAPAQMNEANRKSPQRQLETKFTVRTNGYAVGLRKDDDAFRRLVNAWIAADLENGRLRAVYTKYFGTELPKDMARE